MIVPFEGKTPQIAPSAWVGPGAVIIGDVVIGERSSVWPGAVIRGDYAAIRIGDDVSVQDNVVIHSDDGMTIGNDVTIGHGAVLHGSVIEDGALLGNNCTVLNNSTIGAGSLVAAGALVAPREQVPANCLVLGVPGKVREATPEQLQRLHRQAAGPMTYYENAVRYRAQGIEDRSVWPDARLDAPSAFAGGSPA